MYQSKRWKTEDGLNDVFHNLVLREEPTGGLDGTTIKTEAKHSVDITKPRKMQVTIFCMLIW